MDSEPAPPPAASSPALPPADTESTFLACAIAGLMGAAVALLCLVPPGIHFLTGPLGPLIGGAIAGARLRARGSDAFVAGMVLGGGVVLGAVILGALLFLLVSPELVRGAGGSAASSLRNPEVLVAVALGLFTYEALVGWAGAKLGGFLARLD